MTKFRVLIFLVTLSVVGVVAYFVSFYARGYRFSIEKLEFEPNGLLVLKSDPDGAQIFVNGELKTATNATVPIPPGTYDVAVRKDGFLEWKKRLSIEKEIVTEATAHLFRSVPSLSPLTFTGTSKIVPSKDLTKIVYIVPQQKSLTPQIDQGGLWIIETLNLPLGFSRDPRRVTDGDLTDAVLTWSSDGRQILVSLKNSVFLLEVGSFTSQAQRTNVASQKEEILASWEEERAIKIASGIRKLPEELRNIMERKTKSLVFSPDEEMILYTASTSTQIPDKLIKQLPGASTQTQSRAIKENHTYVYDIKEDRNFLIDDDDADLVIEGGFETSASRRMSWFPTSRHLILAAEGKVEIMDYDGTNRQNVYSGSYVAPFALPSLSTNRLLILTNLGANSSEPNLYSLSLK